jgi:hypothetical protein
MREVLLADVALWGALIMLAALIIIRRWRRSHSWTPARGPRGEARELVNQKMSTPKAANMTGPGRDGRAPDGAAPRPARPWPVPPQATQVGDPTARLRSAPPQATQVGDPTARLRSAPPQATQVGDPTARPHPSGAQRDGQRAPARAATPGERIASYYDHADQPIADYLAELGWTQPPAPPVRPHPRIRVPRQRPPDGTASSVTSSQGN